jgi:hypothetical protein
MPTPDDDEKTFVGNQDAYQRAEQRALALLDAGFHMGGVIQTDRDELHERTPEWPIPRDSEVQQ